MKNQIAVPDGSKAHRGLLAAGWKFIQRIQTGNLIAREYRRANRWLTVLKIIPPAAAIAAPDVRVTRHGSIALIQPLSNAASLWIANKLALETWQIFGDSVAVEPRAAQEIIPIMQADGLCVA